MGRSNLTDVLARSDKEVDFSNRETESFDSPNDESAIVLELQRKKIARLDEEIKDLQQDRDQRRFLSYALFGFMCVYMLLAIIIVFCCGRGFMYLSDKVQITLLTTTLADVIGIFSFVAKYLYHNKQN